MMAISSSSFLRVYTLCGDIFLSQICSRFFVRVMLLWGFHQFRSCSWRYWWLGCYRWSPLCFRNAGRQIADRHWWSSRFLRLSPRSPGRRRRFSQPSACRIGGHRSSRNDFTPECPGCIPRSTSGYAAARREYVHSHADYLIQVIPEIVVINKLHQHLDLLSIVLEFCSSLVKLLDDIADLPPRFPCIRHYILCISAAFYFRFFLFTFFFSLRLSSFDNPFSSELSSLSEPPAGPSRVSGFWLRSTWMPLSLQSYLQLHPSPRGRSSLLFACLLALLAVRHSQHLLLSKIL